MGGTGVIDQFLAVFTRYIDSGFGLLSGEVAFIATALAGDDHGVQAAAHAVKAGDSHGGGSSVNLSESDR